jgi:multiple sugar transport system permease protein
MSTDAQDAREARTAWLFLAPYLILLTVFFFFAAGRAVWFSFTDYDLFTPPTFVGVSNYVALVSDPLFINAFVNSLSFALIVTATQTVLAMLLAVFVNRIARGQGVARTVFYFPSIVSSTVMTLIFLWLFQRQGIATDVTNWFFNHLPLILAFIGILVGVQAALVLNARRTFVDVRPADPYFLIFAVLAAVIGTFALRILQVFPVGEEGEPINWLNTRETFLFMPVTLWSIAVMNIFTTIPVMMLLYLAGLQNISGSLYEAAEIDGATRWQQFIKITVPLLNPVTFAVVTLSLIGTLQMFDQVAILGTAAPIESRITLAYYTYYNAFPPGGSPRIGMASAGAIVLAIVTLIIVFLQRRFGISDKGV